MRLECRKRGRRKRQRILVRIVLELSNPHCLCEDNHCIKLVGAQQLLRLALQRDQPRVQILPVAVQLCSAFREINVEARVVGVQLGQLPKRQRCRGHFWTERRRKAEQVPNLLSARPHQIDAGCSVPLRMFRHHHGSARQHVSRRICRRRCGAAGFDQRNQEKERGKKNHLVLLTAMHMHVGVGGRTGRREGKLSANANGSGKQAQRKKRTYSESAFGSLNRAPLAASAGSAAASCSSPVEMASFFNLAQKQNVQRIWDGAWQSTAHG